jgi:non-ribosomal peptide synthetase component F
VSVANADILTRIPCTTLKKILFAGEVMPNKHLNYWRQHIPDALYSNLYGPTEITVDCTYYIVDRAFDDDEPLPIGIPCRNSDVMLLSENNQRITQPNETGEICVRGSSLAMGYYGNPEKTAEVFVQNPLNDRYRELIYRTGDLGYYNEYNEIMFVGRKDFQIKHMGYRIELGEIEHAALKIDCIGNACALYDTNNKEIVLCYELKSDMDEKNIRKQMLGIIPKYMVPTKYYNLEKFPYNDNGKIDRKELAMQYLK